MKKSALINFAVMAVALSTRLALASDAPTKTLIDHSTPLTYTSGVIHSTTWTGVRVQRLRGGQCQKVSRRLTSMRHLDGIDLPTIDETTVVEPCNALAASRTPQGLKGQ
ncbi:hypothetical protein GALL_308600 [mine drainage metagenome]|jgi:hypothetical protein|uniref:Uncharacterized protein n=1 Tax=mine drainage metagenome TaxID=410659 RepID=A0A1J5RCB2_9ZZZZ